MKVYALAICLCAASLHAQFSGVMRMNCDSTLSNSVDDKLRQLASPLDAGDEHAIECRFSHMEGLSRSHDPRALPLIAHYLDIENPNFARKSTPESKIFRPMPFGGQYPAIVYLTEYGQDAVPVLIQTVSLEPAFSLKAKNAVRALMIVEARNPPAGVQALAQAARDSDSSHSAVLLQAASFATTTWECHSIMAACKNALTARGNELPHN